MDSKDRAKAEAKAQLASIREMVAELRAAEMSEDGDKVDGALQRIWEDPLSVTVRSGWYTLDEGPAGPEEFQILLCWGGPACRITGGLSDTRADLSTVKLQYQDWGTPWTDYALTDEEREDIGRYCAEFYFGE